MVTTTTPGGELVASCTDTVTGDHLAMFTHRPGSGLYTQHTESAHVAASGQVDASCSCRLLTHPSLLWHHRLGHPSLQCLCCMHFRLLGIFDIWAEAPTYEALKPQVQANLDSKVTPFTASGSTFKIVVDGFGKLFSMEEQRDRMERFTYIPFQGKVKLSSPEYKFWVIEQAAECTNNGLPPNMPLRVFIGREVAVSDRTVATKYELSRRRYLGPTAMDAELSLLMANQALARRGALMYDPFVGTGSILVAAAHFGAITL
ncbi:unnamed protein product, partial [Closterium sp. NIES-54]